MCNNWQDQLFLLFCEHCKELLQHCYNPNQVLGMHTAHTCFNLALKQLGIYNLLETLCICALFDSFTIKLDTDLSVNILEIVATTDHMSLASSTAY